MTDVLAGRVPLMFGPAATVWSNVQAGKLKALAVTQPQARGDRARRADHGGGRRAGLFGAASGWACWRPPARRREIVDKLSRAANEALKSNEVLALLRAQGVDPLGGTPAEFARFIDDELKKWAAVVKAAAGIKTIVQRPITARGLTMRGLKWLQVLRPWRCAAGFAGIGRSGAGRLSEPPGAARGRLSAGLGRPTSSRACSATA